LDYFIFIKILFLKKTVNFFHKDFNFVVVVILQLEVPNHYFGFYKFQQRKAFFFSPIGNNYHHLSIYFLTIFYIFYQI